MAARRASTVIIASVLLALYGCTSSDGDAASTRGAGGTAGSGDGGTAGNKTVGSGACVGLDANGCAARKDCYYITHLLACPGTQCPYVFSRCADDGCDPACTTGNVCVMNQTVGGARVEPNDAGACPTGMHLVPSGGTARGHCESNPTYTCASRPAACSGALSCACAGPLCESGHACQGATATQISCVEAAP